MVNSFQFTRTTRLILAHQPTLQGGVRRLAMHPVHPTTHMPIEIHEMNEPQCNESLAAFSLMLSALGVTDVSSVEILPKIKLPGNEP